MVLKSFCCKKYINSYLICTENTIKYVAALKIYNKFTIYCFISFSMFVCLLLLYELNEIRMLKDFFCFPILLFHLPYIKGYI